MDLSQDMSQDVSPPTSPPSSPMALSSPTATMSKTSARQVSSPPPATQNTAARKAMASTMPTRLSSAPSAAPEGNKGSPTKPNYRIRRRDATLTKVLQITTVDPPQPGLLYVPYG